MGNTFCVRWNEKKIELGRHPASFLNARREAAAVVSEQRVIILIDIAMWRIM